MRTRMTCASRVPTLAVTLCGALVLCSGVVAALVLPASSEKTSVLRHPVEVLVTPAAGSPAAGHDGEVLNPGDVVTVAPGGGAQITTGPRKLLLAAASQVRVDGPASAEIRRGSVVALDPGRAWSLQVDQVTVTGITGAVRIDYGYTVRVADYAGHASVNVPTGASSTLVGLDQVSAAGSILDGSPAPLKLDDDGLDAKAAPSLVGLDRGLNALAAQIDADPYLLAGFKASGENPSERILPAAIGAAGTGATATTRARKALTDRAAQGSWGVIAALLSASLPDVRGQLSPLLDSSQAQVTALRAAATGPAPTAAAVQTPAGFAPTPSGRPAAASPAPTLDPTPDTQATGGRGPTPATPTEVSSSAPSSIGTTVRPPAAPTAPTPRPAATPVLTRLLGVVGGLLPSTLPQPVTLGSPPPSISIGPGVAPSPTPLVSSLVTTVGGLLGGSGH